MSDQLSFDRTLGVGLGLRTRRRRVFKILGSSIGAIVAGLQLFQINPLDLLANDPKLFPDAPVFKGAASPTLGSLELKNKESRSSLDIYFKLRESDDREDLELAVRSLRKAMRNERGTASAETLAYLEALEGKVQLDNGSWQAAIQRLEEANRRHPDNPYILDLLALTYDEAIRKLMEKDSWPQDKILSLMNRAAELRRELRRLQALAQVNQPGESLGLAGLPCVDHCASVNPTDRIDVLGDGFAKLVRNADFEPPVKLSHARPGWEKRRDEGTGLDVEAPPLRLVVAAGINDYGAERGFPHLHFAVRDADRVAAGFANSSYTAWKLTDHQATRENVLGALARATITSRPGDDLVFYFSGHGFTDVHGGGAIVTFGPAGIETVALREVESILSFHRGHTTVIVDGCQTRMDVDLEAQGVTFPWGTHRPTVVLAGAPGGVAVESPRLRSSLFTDSLLRHLAAAATTPAATRATEPAVTWISWNAVAADTAERARVLYGVEQRPQVYIPVANFNGTM